MRYIIAVFIIDGECSFNEVHNCILLLMESVYCVRYMIVLY